MRRSAILLLLLTATSPLQLAAADGALDLSFGGDGMVSWLHNDPGPPFPTSSGVTQAAIATSEERVFGVGWFGSAHLRWSSFDDAGNGAGHFCDQESNTLIPFATESRGRAALVDSTGNLLVGGDVAFSGSESQSRPFVARFDLGANGCALDDTYSANGWATFDDESFCDTEDCTVVALGEILPVTGAVATPRTIALVRSVVVDQVLARYFLLGLTTSGGIQTSFGTQGWREVTGSGLGALSPQVAFEIDPRGRINVVVSRYDPDGNFDLDTYLLRYSSTGTADGSIGSNGRIAVADEGPDDGADSTARSLSFDARGRAAIGYDEGGSKFAVIDLEAGAIARRTNSTFFAPVVVAQGDDKLLVIHDHETIDGFRSTRWLVPEALNMGTDSGFLSCVLVGSLCDVDLGSGDSEEVVAATLWHGRPVYLGNAACLGSGSNFSNCGFLMRVENDYIFADGFDTGGRGRWSAASP